jgi:hypothetical protein
MSDYQIEQLEALSLVRMHLKSLPPREREALLASAGEYLGFRADVDRFLATHFGRVCDQACYQSRVSACCSREGIITFFADVVINLLVSSEPEADELVRVLKREPAAFKCVYLGQTGCRWRVKPIVCQMFICEPARARVFTQDPAAEAEWRRLEARRTTFTWPDRPVLFDHIEAYFLRAGCASRLMYLHNSPGLLRLKQKAGLASPRAVRPTGD